MASNFKLRASFHRNMEVLERGMERAVTDGMKKVMDLAADEARANARWRGAGDHSWTGKGAEWTWTGTGLARQSISGYVVSPKHNGRSKLKSFSKPATTNSVGGRAFSPQSHNADPSVLPVHIAQTGHILGVLTMYPEYAKWLQGKELGRVNNPSGIPGTGPLAVKQPILAFGSTYAPILRAHIERVMQALRAQMR